MENIFLVILSYSVPSKYECMIQVNDTCISQRCSHEYVVKQCRKIFHLTSNHTAFRISNTVLHRSDLWLRWSSLVSPFQLSNSIASLKSTPFEIKAGAHGGVDIGRTIGWPNKTAWTLMRIQITAWIEMTTKVPRPSCRVWWVTPLTQYRRAFDQYNHV